MRLSPTRSDHMLNSLNSALAKTLTYKSRWMLAYLRQELIGIAQDFWKDGTWEKAESGNNDNFKRFFSPKAEKTPKEEIAPLWHAAPGEIDEKMWGPGFMCPGDEFVTGLLIKPFGITKDTAILDLAAGLGGRMRKTSKEFKVYITGLETDPDIAARGMTLSVAAGQGKRAAIAPYDPMNLVDNHRYDCIIARETIYRVPDKEKFVKSIAACCKRDAQISFTDYIVNPEVHDEPAIEAWRKAESGADPVGLVEMAELWAKAGFSLRVHDDQTEFYKKEVKQGLLRLARFVASGVKPDAETKTQIEKQLRLWAQRMTALEHGMKFYRFYGLK